MNRRSNWCANDLPVPRSIPSLISGELASIFEAMKRLLCLVAILVSSPGIFAQPCQAPSSPSTLAVRELAARQVTEERFKRLTQDIETLTEANQTLREEIGKLNNKIAQLQSEQSRLSAAQANNGVQDDLKKLADKIMEVDKKREADKQVISEEIKTSIGKLENAITKAAATTPAPRATKTKVPVDDVPISDKGFTYTVQSGDSIGLILKAYNAEFKKQGLKPITQRQIVAANPNVKLDPLLKGTKIIIPAPVG